MKNPRTICWGFYILSRECSNEKEYSDGSINNPVLESIKAHLPSNSERPLRVDSGPSSQGSPNVFFRG